MDVHSRDEVVDCLLASEQCFDDLEATRISQSLEHCRLHFHTYVLLCICMTVSSTHYRKRSLYPTRDEDSFERRHNRDGYLRLHLWLRLGCHLSARQVAAAPPHERIAGCRAARDGSRRDDDRTPARHRDRRGEKHVRREHRRCENERRQYPDVG